MGYYIRVLSTSSKCIPVSYLQSAIEKDKLRATISVEDGTSDDWTQLLLAHDDGTEIACIERNVVQEDSLGSDEIGEFVDEVEDCKPASAAKWLIEYFSRIQCIYSFQLLGGTDQSNGWNILGAIKNRIWSYAPSIIQADFEGFSNEKGYHILWQFGDTVSGDWWVGVLQDGQWKHFQMDLGNRQQREAFFEGRVPEGAKLA